MDGDVAILERRRKSAQTADARTLNLALQGGGAHGAFTWGVLDRLLEDERIAFEGVSATSTGAVNAAVLAYGLTLGGREGARTALAGFWRRIAHAGASAPFQPSLLDRLGGVGAGQLTPAFAVFDLMTRLFSPYEFNPFNQNPLREALERTVDFQFLRERSALKLYISATHVRSGRSHVFRPEEISVESVLASACVPSLFQAVEVHGEAYWDGGYMGNPAIAPLIAGCSARDVLVVHVQPGRREELPATTRDIMNRINEISCNAALAREMRAIACFSRLVDEGRAGACMLKRMLVHAIAADDVLGGLPAATKLSCDWEFLIRLRDLGRERAQAWLDESFEAVGRRSSLDISQTYG